LAVVAVVAASVVVVEPEATLKARAQYRQVHFQLASVVAVKVQQTIQAHQLEQQAEILHLTV
jgi:hypothetical protein